MKTYAVQHPGMSHALLIDSHAGRTESALKAWACTYILREFDVVLPAHEFVVQEVQLDPTEVEFSLFDSDGTFTEDDQGNWERVG